MQYRNRIARAVALVLAFTLSLSLLTGCGKNNQTEAGTMTTTVATTDGQSIIPTLAPDAVEVPEASPTPTPPLLTEKQQNSINMLNYLTVLVQEIRDAKNNRVYLESAYSELVNNTEPNIVDELTLDEYENILSSINNYRLTALKRERLQYIFDQNNAHALRSAIPNPLALLTAVQANNPLKSIASLAYMAVNSYTSYSSYTDQLKLQFLQDGWALDDEEAENLHRSRTSMFAYMVRVARENELPAGYTLNEESVEDFVKWVNNGNPTSRIRWLESNEETYARYGEYWLALADSYYEKENYSACLEALRKYESLDIHIFRFDMRLSRTLPGAIIAASEVLSEKEYVAEASRLAELIVKNTKAKDWSLRYFAAQTFIDLYAKTHSTDYLKRAYEIAYDNVNELVMEQKSLNAEYLAPVAELPVPKDGTKEEKDSIKDYNKALKEARKIALPPVYEPLQLNCELLLAIADELKISDAERKEIDLILHPASDPVLFLDKVMDAKFTFSTNPKVTPGQANAEYDVTVTGTHRITLPAEYLADGCEVVVSVKGSTNRQLSSWTIAEVDRKKSDQVADFVVQLEYKPDPKISFEDRDKITIKVYLPGSKDQETREQDAVTFSFTVSKKTTLKVPTTKFVRDT
ncbi:MAG: hypothetical protein J6A79_02645 [Clostridia bacterium]|nr:hypothetical protein [Clostridia bacterium]